MKEEWRDIPEYEGYYQVSNLARVRGVERTIKWNANFHQTISERILVQSKKKGGYLKVQLSKNNIQKTRMVHNLVALCFNPNPSNYPMINHKDGVTSNNLPSNIEWCDSKHNVRHSYANGLNTKAKPVLQYTMSGEFIKEYVSASEAGRSLTNKRNKISAVCRGVRKSSLGFKWRYKNSNQ